MKLATFFRVCLFEVEKEVNASHDIAERRAEVGQRQERDDLLGSRPQVSEEEIGEEDEEGSAQREAAGTERCVGRQGADVEAGRAGMTRAVESVGANRIRVDVRHGLNSLADSDERTLVLPFGVYLRYCSGANGSAPRAKRADGKMHRKKQN